MRERVTLAPERMRQARSRLRIGAAFLALLIAVPSAVANGPDVADATESMDREALRALVERSADVNVPQADGMTALHWAARHDDLAVAELLVAAGADVDAANRYGVTPLALACINGNGALVELLLDEGADPNATLPGGESALMTAARTGRVRPVRALLAHGADLNARIHGMGRQEGAGANAFLFRMRDPGIFDFETRAEQTALVWAAAEGHAAVVAELIKAGADFRAKLASGFTPLLFAARNGHIDVVKELVQAGVDPNERIDPGSDWRHTGYGAKLRPDATALHVAVENGHFELAAYLLDAGADPNAAGLDGYRAQHAIAGARRVPPGDANPPPAPTGSLTALDFVRELAEHGADLDARMTGTGLLNLGVRVLGPTAFLAATQNADIELMKTLVELGANPTLTAPGRRTPLMLVGARTGTEREVAQAMDLLLDLGVPLDAVDSNGETAMHAAAHFDRAEPIKLLAERGAGADVWNLRNKHGCTPLAIAVGFRGPRSFRPRPVAEAAIREAMLAAGVVPPEKVMVAAQKPTSY